MMLRPPILSIGEPMGRLSSLMPIMYVGVSVPSLWLLVDAHGVLQLPEFRCVYSRPTSGYKPLVLEQHQTNYGSLYYEQLTSRMSYSISIVVGINDVLKSWAHLILGCFQSVACISEFMDDEIFGFSALYSQNKDVRFPRKYCSDNNPKPGPATGHNS